MALSTIGRNQLNTGIDDNSDATAITIDSSERVGIGATNMDEMLLIQQTASGANTDVTIRSANDGNSRINFGDQSSDGSGRIDYDHTSNHMAVTTNSSERMRIDSSGNVGIGDTPNRRLHVKAAGAEFSVTNTSGTADKRTMNMFLVDNTKMGLRILNDAGNAGGTHVTIDDTGIVDAAAFTADYGTSFGLLDSTSIGDSNIPYNSWGTPNSTYYRWVLPKAGTYLLSSNLRIRLWGVHGYIKARLYNNTTSTAISGGNISGTSAGGQCNIRMLFENGGGGTAEQFNVNITANYILTTTADNQDIHHQLQSNNNSSNSSLQSDANGRNIHWWQRIG